MKNRESLLNLKASAINISATFKDEKITRIANELIDLIDISLKGGETK